MFDSKKDGARAMVAVSLIDGGVEKVSVRLTLSAKLNDILNNADAFLDVLDLQGRQYFIAKHRIARVELIEVPKANRMREGAAGADFDPHAILGVARDADAETIRRAYHGLVKAYHPDRFSGVDLPKELRDYAAALLVRINLAMEQIGGG